MPRKHEWTPAEDTALRAYRADRLSWDAIAFNLHISRSAARERGRTIGALRPALPRPHESDPNDDPNRDPLPAGHPISWNLITAGTLLAGTPCPWPPLPPAPASD